MVLIFRDTIAFFYFSNNKVKIMFVFYSNRPYTECANAGAFFEAYCTNLEQCICNRVFHRE